MKPPKNEHTHPQHSIWRPLARALHQGEISDEEYIQHLLHPIKERDSQLNALVPEDYAELRLQIALQKLHRQFPSDQAPPPLFGMPIGVKDIIHVNGMVTRAGTRVPADLLQDKQADCITRLENQGAIILGKTVTAEFAFIAPGPTSNPRAPGHTPGGSSSGSASAVAAGYCPAALGTQTVGSINRPAAFCGVVGFKPSRDRISRAGVLPLAPSCDHVGLITCDIVTLNSLLPVLLKQHQQAPPLSDKPKLLIPHENYLRRTSLAGRQHFDKAIVLLQELGYEIAYSSMLTDFETLFHHHHQLVAFEAAKIHHAWHAQYFPLYREETSELIERGKRISEATANKAIALQMNQQQKLDGELAKAKAQCWLSPATVGPAPIGLGSTGDSVMQLPWTQAGLPTINLPFGEIDGRPAAIQLTTRLNGDEFLTKFSARLEDQLRNIDSCL